MATTRLTDVIEPVVYQGYMSLASTRANRFIVSGIVANDPILDGRAAGPSQETNIPFWNDLDHSDKPDLSNDNPADKAIPAKITAGKQVGQTAYLHKSWSAMSLNKYLIGADPVSAITSYTNNWWSSQFQDRLLKSCMGIYADNVASNSSDMVYAINAASGTPGDSNKIGKTSVVRAELTMGDAMGGIIAMAVHSIVFGRMKELDLIDFVQPSSESGLIAETPQGNPMFQGKAVIVDDTMPVEVDGNSNTIYTTVLFGNGAFGLGNGQPTMPVEVGRDATSGNGAGEDVLHERRHWLLHPFGFSMDTTQIAGQSASPDELATAALWSRVIPRKLVPLAFLRTNG